MNDLHTALKGYYEEADPMMPAYMRAIYAIKAAIVNGLLNTGDPVPSTKIMSGLFQINPMTASRALQFLDSSGIALKARRGSPHVVTADAFMVKDGVEEEIKEHTIKYLLRTMDHFGFTKTVVDKWLKEVK